MKVRNKGFHPISNLLLRLARTEYVRSAMEERADLSEFKRRPDKRILAGISAIGFSYVIGWPLIGFLGVCSIRFHSPLLIAAGGPTAYVVSHLMFLLGMYLTGYHHFHVFLRWAVRATMEKLLKKHVGPDTCG